LSQLKSQQSIFLKKKLFKACLLLCGKKGAAEIPRPYLYPEIPSRRAVPRKADRYVPESFGLAADLFGRGARADFGAAAGHPDLFVPIVSSYIKSHISSPLKVLPLLYPIKKRLPLLLKKHFTKNMRV